MGRHVETTVSWEKAARTSFPSGDVSLTILLPGYLGFCTQLSELGYAEISTIATGALTNPWSPPPLLHIQAEGFSSEFKVYWSSERERPCLKNRQTYRQIERTNKLEVFKNTNHSLNSSFNEEKKKKKKD